MTSGGGKGTVDQVLILSGTLVLTLGGPAAGKQRSALLAALGTDERILVSLIDGRRTIRDLTQLSGLPPAAARDRLRSLFERGLLVPAGSPAPPAPATQAPAEPRRITRERGSSPTHASPRITLGAGGAVRAEAPPPLDPVDPPRAQPPAAARAWEAEQPPSAELDPASQAAPADRAGQPFRVGAYDVATRIGQGGMGSIYVCRRAGAAGFQRLFALKVVRQRSGQEEAAVRSFLHEGRIGALLAHPNLQSVVDMGSYKDQPFLVLDYVEGASLADLLVDGRPPPAGVTVSILLDVLRGLQAAHDTVDAEGRALGLVHGDVSPPNILVGVDGGARLGDFGSGRFTALAEQERAPAERMIPGRPAYMAPEQLAGESLDARADISLGVVMWSALTGEELFTAATHELTVRNTLTKRIPPPSAFGAPACLDDICLRALRRPRQERYFTAEEMASALLKVAAAAELVAPPHRVGRLVREQSGEALAERRRLTQAAFAGVSRRATPASEAAPEATPAHTHSLALTLSDSMRSTLVVAAAPAVQARTTAASKKRYLYLSIALGVLAGALAVAIVRSTSRSMSGGAEPSADSVRASSPAEAPRSAPPLGPAASGP